MLGLEEIDQLRCHGHVNINDDITVSVTRPGLAHVGLDRNNRHAYCSVQLSLQTRMPPWHKINSNLI